MDSCGFKVEYGGGEISCDCVERALSSFNYSNKKYDRGGKTSQPIHIIKAGMCTVMEFLHM